ncbi:MAG: AlpA family phage regulatory protein [Gemmatimonadota bacterium]|nr:AlpA family phage regulatory protein [Gemmatimonadota bacterium]MDE2864100.1 AlpA family phage regulatory protein [Gemmatimonadota bacterium]
MAGTEVSFPRLMRRSEVEEAVGLSTATLYRQMSTGSFPRPVRVGSRSVRWRATDVLAWLESRPAALPEDLGFSPAT